MKRHAILIVTGTLVAAALLAGADAGGTKKVFSHKFHINDAGAECATCHDVKNSDEPRLNQEACKDCHDTGAPAWMLPARHRKLVFAYPHKRHAGSKELACKNCHQAVADDAIPDGKPFLTPDRCLACHAEKGTGARATECVKCHGVDQKTVRPTSHKIAWPVKHGGAAQLVEKGEHGKDCTLCHGEAACRACHTQTRPKSHTGLWRVRTHGTAAGWDRDRCKTCHETGTCVRCHQQTAPMSHTGAWKQVHGLTAGSKDNEHCRACHQTGFCNTCHRLK